MDVTIFFLVICLCILMSETKSQVDKDQMKECDLCNFEGLPDCRRNDTIPIYKTVNCELPGQICILKIVDSTSGDPNEPHINPNGFQMVCLFKRMKTNSNSIPTPLEYNTSSSRDKTETMVPEGSMASVPYEFSTEVQSTELATIADAGSSIPTSDLESPTVFTSCIACDSLTDTSCLNKVDKLKYVKCPKLSACLSLYSDHKLVRNCSSSFPPEIVAKCIKPGNTMCERCIGVNCNKKPWKQCYMCNSRNDSNCVNWSGPGAIPTFTCPNYNDYCLIRITPDGHTVRECASVDYKGQHNELHSLCDSSLCNNGVFPKNRLQCVQCRNCQSPVPAQPCTLYTPQEQCFMFIAADNKMIRGCVSNIDVMSECRKNAPKCVTCNATKACNDMLLMREATLSCSKCNSLVDPSCAWAQPATSVAKCRNKVLYYLQETCMTEYNQVTKNAVRDCLLDHGACMQDDRNCSTCVGNGCNRGNLRFQKCIQCNSKFPGQEKCSESAEGIPSTRCAQGDQIFQTKGCFLMTKGNITTRGCAAELLDEDRDLCKTSAEGQCIFCEDDGCNNQLAKSGAWKIAQSYFLVLFGVIFRAIYI